MLRPNGPYANAVPPRHCSVDPYPGRPWTIHEGDNRCSLDIYDADHFDAIVTDCPYGLSTELDPPNLDREALWERLTEYELNPRPLSQYLMAEYSTFVGEHQRDPSPDEWFVLADIADRKRVLEGPMIAQLIWHWQTTGENPRVTGKGFMGNEWDALVPPPNAWRAAWRAAWRVLKPGAYLLTFAGTRTDDLVALSLRFAGFRVEDRIIWLNGQGMAKRRRLDLAVDTYLGMKEQRPVIRPRPNPSATKMAPASEQLETSAATPEAVRHVGWDRGLHPRQEPCIVASKPMRGLVAETVLRYGTGGMNVDGCRIERGDAGVTPQPDKRPGNKGIYRSGLGGGLVGLSDARGGYPTDVILDEAAAAELDAMTGDTKAGKPREDRGTGGIWTKGNGVPCGPQYGDIGGASRFFYVAKAATSERDKGLEALDVMTPGERSGRVDGSVGISGYAGTRGEARNPHATVKPVKLMQYLVRLACPPGAWDPDMNKRPVVLDLYMGSGTTGVACMVEGVRFVGCELGATYAAVARQRLQHAYALPREASPAAPGNGEESDAPSPRVASGGQSSLF